MVDIFRQTAVGKDVKGSRGTLEVRSRMWIDFSGIDFSGTDFSGTDLSGSSEEMLATSQAF